MLDIRDWMLAKKLMVKTETDPFIGDQEEFLLLMTRLLGVKRWSIVGWRRSSATRVVTPHCHIGARDLILSTRGKGVINRSLTPPSHEALFLDWGLLNHQHCREEPEVFTVLSGDQIRLGVSHPTARWYPPNGVGLLLWFDADAPLSIDKRSLLESILPVLVQPLYRAIFDGHRARGLTAREAEILALLDRGLSVDAIAKTIDRSMHTVNFHLRNVYRKLGAHNRQQAVSLVRDRGLLSHR